jgi:hypothetical protein
MNSTNPSSGEDKRRRNRDELLDALLAPPSNPPSNGDDTAPFAPPAWLAQAFKRQRTADVWSIITEPGVSPRQLLNDENATVHAWAVRRSSDGLFVSLPLHLRLERRRAADQPARIVVESPQWPTEFRATTLLLAKFVDSPEVASFDGRLERLAGRVRSVEIPEGKRPLDRREAPYSAAASSLAAKSSTPKHERLGLHRFHSPNRRFDCDLEELPGKVRVRVPHGDPQTKPIPRRLIVEAFYEGLEGPIVAFHPVDLKYTDDDCRWGQVQLRYEPELASNRLQLRVRDDALLLDRSQRDERLAAEPALAVVATEDGVANGGAFELRWDEQLRRLDDPAVTWGLQVVPADLK